MQPLPINRTIKTLSSPLGMARMGHLANRPEPTKRDLDQNDVMWASFYKSMGPEIKRQLDSAICDRVAEQIIETHALNDALTLLGL